MLDLWGLKGTRVDPSARTVCVDGGCRWDEVDHATHPFGLTIDNLLAVDMVLADGSFVTASAENHSDLFWAVRGGGG